MSQKEARHIVTLIENTPFAGLSEAELSVIRIHTADCHACRLAFEAAYVSTMMLKERARESVEPSPFFQTRVLATLREQEATESWSLDKLWRAAGALASSMVATVALLMVLTFALPATQESSSRVNAYSPEAVLMNEAGDDLSSDSQVLSTLYGAEEDLVK